MPARNFLDATFITHFEAEVKTAYQNQGMGTRGRVRFRGDVVGRTAEFPVVGAGQEPVTKGFADYVPVFEHNWQRVTCTLEDRYYGTYLDPRADLVTNVDERRAIVFNIANAFARFEDQLIVNALNQTTNPNNQTSTDDNWSTEAPIQAVMEAFGRDSVFSAGNLYAYVTWNTWGQLLRLQSFINAELGGDPSLTRLGLAAKMYYGFAILPYELLPVAAGSSRFNLFWQRDAVGLAVSNDFELTMHEIPERDVVLARGYCRMGAVLIDHRGAIKRRAAA